MRTSYVFSDLSLDILQLHIKIIYVNFSKTQNKFKHIERNKYDILSKLSEIKFFS